MNQQPQTESAGDELRRVVNPHLVTRGNVVIIGLGGIGLYLTRAAITFLTGLLQSSAGNGNVENGKVENGNVDVLLVDGDSFSIENTYRMDVPDFGNKAAVLGLDMLQRTDVPGLVIRWETEFVSAENVERLIQNGDCVLLACDNHATRKCVGRYCSSGQLDDVVLISGGNDGVEDGLRGTYGNVQTYVRENGVDLTAPIDRFHPEIAQPADRSPESMDCIEMAATGALQFSIVNLAVASAMCGALLRLLMPVVGERMYDEVALDVLDATQIPHWLSGPQDIEAT